MTNPIESKDPIKDNSQQVELLFDYTKFHVAMYSTFASAVLALLAGQFAVDWAICKPLLAWSLLPIAVAGFAGGVIASSLPHLYGTRDVLDEPIGPYKLEKWRLRYWTYLEHTAFWLAVLMAAAALVLPLVTGCCKRSPVEPKPVDVIIKSMPR